MVFEELGIKIVVNVVDDLGWDFDRRVLLVEVLLDLLLVELFLVLVFGWSLVACVLRQLDASLLLVFHAFIEVFLLLFDELSTLLDTCLFGLDRVLPKALGGPLGLASDADVVDAQVDGAAQPKK